MLSSYPLLSAHIGELYGIEPTVGCATGFVLGQNGICEDVITKPATLSCASRHEVLVNGMCVKYTYEHVIQSCQAGYVVDANGHCTTQVECQPELSCPEGLLDPSLNSCTNHYHSDAELDCGEDAVFIAGLCYESVISAPIITCDPGFERVGNECVHKTIIDPIPDCADDLVMSADMLKCEGHRHEEPVPYCESAEVQPRNIDGINWCEAMNRDMVPDKKCNDGWILAPDANGVEMCQRIQWELPQMSCEQEMGYRLVYDTENREPRCEISSFVEAEERCDNIMAVEEPELDALGVPIPDTIESCIISITESTIPFCDEEDGFFFEKNACIKTIRGEVIDDCQNGQYDSLADVCYTHRYISGNYMCPEGCNYNKHTLNCVCQTRTDPHIHCPHDCYRYNNECFKNEVRNDVTVCSENFGYDLAKDMCVNETRTPPIASCTDGSTAVDGYCSVLIKKEQSEMCQYGYTLRDHQCIKIV